MEPRDIGDTEPHHFGDIQSQSFVHTYQYTAGRSSAAGEHLGHHCLALIKLSLVLGMLSLPLFRRVHDLDSPDRVRRYVSFPAVDRDHRQWEREHDLPRCHVREKELLIGNRPIELPPSKRHREYLKLWGPPDRAVGDHRYCLWGPAAVDLGATGRPSAHRHGFKAACSLML